MKFESMCTHNTITARDTSQNPIQLTDCLCQERKPYLTMGRKNIDGGETLQIVTD